MRAAALLLIIFSTHLAFGASAAEPSDLAGTWFVTSTLTPNAWGCADEPKQVQGYVWIVSVEKDGTISVAVQGETAYPKLTGKVTGDALLLTGDSVAGRSPLGNRVVQNVSWLNLQVSKDGSLGGVRRALSTKTELREVDVIQPNGTLRRSRETVTLPCFVDFSIVAKKQ